jgi:hypothetical protein
MKGLKTNSPGFNPALTDKEKSAGGMARLKKNIAAFF